MLHKKKRQISLRKGKFAVAGITAAVLSGAVILSEPAVVQAEASAHHVWEARTVEEVSADVAHYDSIEDLRDYEFVWGDTLWAISEAVGFSVNELAQTFDIANPDLIFADYTFGEQEALPANRAPQVSNTSGKTVGNGTTEAETSVEENTTVETADSNEEASAPVENNNAASDSATESETVTESEPVEEPVQETAEQDLSKVDTNGNGKVTIEEAEAAGHVMPIKSDHWLYPYMIDGDSDGMVGE